MALNHFCTNFHIFFFLSSSFFSLLHFFFRSLAFVRLNRKKRKKNFPLRCDFTFHDVNEISFVIYQRGPPQICAFVRNKILRNHHQLRDIQLFQIRCWSNNLKFFLCCVPRIHTCHKRFLSRASFRPVVALFTRKTRSLGAAHKSVNSGAGTGSSHITTASSRMRAFVVVDKFSGLRSLLLNLIETIIKKETMAHLKLK